ncbi:MAG: DUF1622 domain-containing protein [Cyanobium sp. Prado107]|jgi:uncharacterized membrane protein|nr:DUF1622 domain-containing protein [Cyanobium sp. Prado107]
MELLEHLEPGLQVLAGWLRFVLETLSVLCVLTGLVSVLRMATPPTLLRRRHRPTTGVRLTFGSWLSMALEFQLGADIVATTTAPTGQNLIQLAAVAVIRTFLNVFLAREIESEQKMEAELQRAGAYE